MNHNVGCKHTAKTPNPIESLHLTSVVFLPLIQLPVQLLEVLATAARRTVTIFLQTSLLKQSRSLRANNQTSPALIDHQLVWTMDFFGTKLRHRCLISQQPRRGSSGYFEATSSNTRLGSVVPGWQAALIYPCRCSAPPPPPPRHTRSGTKVVI